MRTLVWLLRGFLFFALFAFALNNNHEASLRWFFGHEWRMPQIIIVLIAFGCGCAFGVLAMVPAWWHHRRAARRSEALADPTPPPAPAAAPPHQDGV
ncbi:LapA family protein [Roseateles paludis]|jgi:uncharacterized integral membrane protein|uniref:LapA family protein n=1 Tax=Roseateles paludis TaxID=3145238 RepID=A0ABV0G3T9_9BURK